MPTAFGSVSHIIWADGGEGGVVGCLESSTEFSATGYKSTNLLENVFLQIPPGTSHSHFLAVAGAGRATLWPVEQIIPQHVLSLRVVASALRVSPGHATAPRSHTSAGPRVLGRRAERPERSPRPVCRTPPAIAEIRFPGQPRAPRPTHLMGSVTDSVTRREFLPPALPRRNSPREHYFPTSLPNKIKMDLFILMQKFPGFWIIYFKIPSTFYIYNFLFIYFISILFSGGGNGRGQDKQSN